MKTSVEAVSVVKSDWVPWYRDEPLDASMRLSSSECPLRSVSSGKTVDWRLSLESKSGKTGISIFVVQLTETIEELRGEADSLFRLRVFADISGETLSLLIPLKTLASLLRFSAAMRAGTQRYITLMT